MRKTLSMLTFVLLFHLSKGQEPERHFELGSTLITVNSFRDSEYAAQTVSPIEYLNGLFFRYTKKRLGIRFITSYSEYYHAYTTPPGYIDGGGGDAENKDFSIGIGGQYSILKKKEWLYTFLDLSYRNVYSTGHYYGGIWGTSERFTITSEGIDCFLGLGIKIKTGKNIYLCPELGYYGSSQVQNKTTTVYTGSVSSYKHTVLFLNPLIKLHLTAKF